MAVAERQQLTEKQQQVWDLLSEGFTPEKIAGRLGVGESAVESHIRRIRERGFDPDATVGMRGREQPAAEAAADGVGRLAVEQLKRLDARLAYCREQYQRHLAEASSWRRELEALEGIFVELEQTAARFGVTEYATTSSGRGMPGVEFATPVG